MGLRQVACFKMGDVCLFVGTIREGKFENTAVRDVERRWDREKDGIEIGSLQEKRPPCIAKGRKMGQ